MRNGFTSEHWDDANGKPAGGISQGVGFVVSWQNGPLGACTCPTDNVEIATSARNGIHIGICQRKTQNGAFVEDVLGTALDRLRYYNAGEFADDYNDTAINHLEMALYALADRTRRRVGAGVEGTQQKVGG